MVCKSNIIWGKTKKKVEDIITKYTYYNLSIDDHSSFDVSLDSFVLQKLETNLEDAYSVLSPEEKQNRINFINYFRISFNRLTTDERKIIYWTYLDKEDNYDDRFIANSLGFSLGYYYIKKKETLIRFAYSLGVEETEK